MAIRNILVIDDSQTDLHMLTEMLTKNGYAVITAESAEAGVARAKRDKPDLILMDIVMPGGMNGFEATRAITRDPDTAGIPVVIFSNKRQETDRAWGLRQGAKDYLVKPVTEKVLIDRIKSL